MSVRAVNLFYSYGRWCKDTSLKQPAEQHKKDRRTAAARKPSG